MSIYRKPFGEYGEVQRRKQESWVLWASRDGHSSSVCVFPSRFFSLYVYLCQSHGWEDSPEKEMATHSSTLALKIPWTEELGAGYYPWGRKESGTTEWLHFLSFTFFTHWAMWEAQKSQYLSIIGMLSPPALILFQFPYPWEPLYRLLNSPSSSCPSSGSTASPLTCASLNSLWQ